MSEEYCGYPTGECVLSAETARLIADLAAACEALHWYADQMCEFSRDDEGCGKYDDDTCGGCRARAALSRIDALTKGDGDD